MCLKDTFRVCISTRNCLASFWFWNTLMLYELYYLICIKKMKWTDFFFFRFGVPKITGANCWKPWLQSLPLRSQQRSQLWYFKVSSFVGPHAGEVGRSEVSSGTLKSLCSFKLHREVHPFSQQMAAHNKDPLLWSCEAHQGETRLSSNPRVLQLFWEKKKYDFTDVIQLQT